MAEVGELTAKLTLDTTDFDKKTSGLEGKLSGLTGGIGKALGGVTAGVTAAVGAAAAGVTAIVKESVSAFGEYEQLVGGAQKIFDQMDYSQIAADASNAYMTMNMSASQYLSMINTVGAAFTATMGDQKGYDTAKQGMQAIADYASGTGRSVEELNQKYAMITRSTSSYQSIADQFSGILPATSQGFLEQAQAAGFLSDQYTQLTQVPIDEYQQAVSAMLEKGVADLNLTDNTAAETTETVTGSLAGLQAAWQNLITGMSDSSADLGSLLQNVVTMAEAVAENVLPVVEQALLSIGNLILQIAPMIAERLPELLAQLVPMLIETSISIVNALVESLPMLVSTIASAMLEILPSLVEAIVNVLNTLMTSVIPMLAELAIKIVVSLAQNLATNAPMLVTGVVAMITTLLQMFVENLPTIVMAGLTIITGLVDGLIQNLSLITDAVVILITTFIATIVEHLPDIFLAAVEIGAKIVAGIVFAIPNLIISVGKMLGIIEDTKNSVDDHATNMQSSIHDSTTGISTDIDSMIQNLNQKTQQASQSIDSTSSTISSATDDMNKKADNLKDTAKEVQRQMTTSFGTITDIVGFARASMQQSFDKMTDMIDNLIDKLNALGMVSASPRVDPSGVEAGCNAIVAAVERAVSALNRLGSAGGGGGIGGGRASGGYVSAGTTYLVGELGPELITPTRSGYVHTADETAGMLGGGGRSISININGDIYDNERSMRQKMKSAVLGVLQEQMAYG